MFKKRRRLTDKPASRAPKRRPSRSGGDSEDWIDVIGAAIAALFDALF